MQIHWFFVVDTAIQDVNALIIDSLPTQNFLNDERICWMGSGDILT
jgi:hypothetical protein